MLHGRGREKQATDKEKYASVVGGFNYPTHMTRPDFAGPLNVLQRFTANPSVEHELALGHFMRYARGTVNLGITHIRLLMEVQRQNWKHMPMLALTLQISVRVN